MNIQSVGLKDGQRLQCCVCLKMCRPIWADLDGPAFKAYYCYDHLPVQAGPRQGNGNVNKEMLKGE